MICNRCKKDKPITEFHHSKNGRKVNGETYSGRCKACVSKLARDYNDRPEIQQKRREKSIMSKYGITFTQKELQWKKQEEKCKICFTPISLQKSHIDHDHKTGKIRGILCGNCNKILGLAKDNPFLFSNAIGYLIFANYDGSEKLDYQYIR